MWNATLIVEKGEAWYTFLTKEKKSDYLTHTKLPTWHNSEIDVNANDNSGGD